MKDNIDFVSAVAGAVASFSRAIKRKMNWKMVIVSAIIGAFLGFGAIGVLLFFLKEASIHMIVVTAFAAGWASNELTDVFEEAVKDSYDIAKAYAKARIEKRNKSKKDE